MIHVNTDMEEMTSQGEAGHIVLGSGRAFLELLSRTDDNAVAALTQSVPVREAWPNR